jgi:osmotically-inducible protein OsmY
MKMKSTCSLALMAVVGTMLTTSTPARASDTDNRIVSAAASSYVFVTYLQQDSIKTVSQDGVVTLTGTVAEESHKILAQKTVENLPGVKSVDNQLLVTGEQPAAQSDPWIRMKVKAALLFDRNVSGYKTLVYVTNGIVTLQGHVKSEAQEELTAEHARDIDGVKGINNDMTIDNTLAGPAMTEEKVDDASITGEILFVLLTHHSTSSMTTQISTTDGAVTLTGTAKNVAEKNLITRFAADIKGVTGVINNMTVSAAAN